MSYKFTSGLLAPAYYMVDVSTNQQNVITKKNLDEDQNFFLPVNESTEILKKLRKSTLVMPSVSYKMFKDFAYGPYIVTNKYFDHFVGGWDASQLS